MGDTMANAMYEHLLYLCDRVQYGWKYTIDIGGETWWVEGRRLTHLGDGTFHCGDDGEGEFCFHANSVVGIMTERA